MIKSFSRDEKKALVAILKFIVNADGRISEGEIAKFNEIAEKKGFDLDFSGGGRDICLPLWASCTAQRRHDGRHRRL